MVKMFSRTQSSTPSDGSPSSNEFQILSPPSSNVNGTFSHLNDIHFSISTAPMDLSPEEIQMRLRDILKENVDLKDTLHQNNVAMREQFNRLLSWQNEVATVQQQHKSKFEETRLLVQRLHTEKAELEQQLKEADPLKEENTDLKDKLKCLQATLEETEEKCQNAKREQELLAISELQLKEQLVETRRGLEELKVTFSRIQVEKQDLMAINAELQSRVSNLSRSSSCQGSLESSEPQSQQSYVVVNPPPFTAGNAVQKSAEERPPTEPPPAVRDLMVQLRCEQEKGSRLMAELIEERKKASLVNKELTETRTKLQSMSTSMPPPSSPESRPSPEPRQGSSAILNDLKESEQKFTRASDYLLRYKDRCCSLENWLGMYQERLESLRSKDDELIDQLRVEVTNLRKTLDKEQCLNQDDKRHLLEARQQFELLLRDYQELLRSWETYEQEQTSRGRQSEAYYELQVKTLKEQIDSLTAKLVSSDESLNAKNEEVRRLEKRMMSVVLEMDKIPILQAQVDVYQTDFRAERETCQKAIKEKDRLAMELRDLQNRNQQLVDELETYQQAQFHQLRDQSAGRRVAFAPSRPSSGNSNSSSGTNLRYSDYEGGRRDNWACDASATSGGGGGRSTVMRTYSGRNLAGEQPGQRTIATPPANPFGGTSRVRDYTPSPEENLYYCPKCNLGFSELQPLETHVNMCLDVDDPFL